MCFGMDFIYKVRDTNKEETIFYQNENGLTIVLNDRK